MDKWEPNEEVLEDLLNEYEHYYDLGEPVFGIEDENYRVKDLIYDLKNKTERGRIAYEKLLELNYLACLKCHAEQAVETNNYPKFRT